MELRGGGSVSKVALLCFVSLCIFSICALTTGSNSSRACSDIRRWRTNSSCTQEQRRGMTAGGGRRRLWGPGSSPPRCASKCGKCTPCRPVHVPVPPGTPVTAEYYPEAWRCKCGNRLYMP